MSWPTSLFGCLQAKDAGLNCCIQHTLCGFCIWCSALETADVDANAIIAAAAIGILAFPALENVALVAGRRKLVKKYKIEEGVCESIAIRLCCPFCAQVQEVNTVIVKEDRVYGCGTLTPRNATMKRGKNFLAVFLSLKAKPQKMLLAGIGQLAINCGEHEAESCEKCPDNNGFNVGRSWCNGDMNCCTPPPLRKRYCTPAVNSSDSGSLYVYSFYSHTNPSTFSNISNLTSGYSTGYGDFTGKVVESYDTGSFDFTAEIVKEGYFGLVIWIDWDQNYEFDNATEKVFSASGGLQAL